VVLFLTRISRSRLKKKRTKKKQTRAQAEIEQSNILDFIYANMPSDVTEARKQAIQQTEEAHRLREEARQQSQAERERKREEKRVQKEARYAYKKDTKQTEEEEEKTAKTKTKVVKTKGDDGFVTLSTTFTKLDEEGQVVETLTATGKSGKQEETETSTKKKDKKKTCYISHILILVAKQSIRCGKTSSGVTICSGNSF